MLSVSCHLTALGYAWATPGRVGKTGAPPKPQKKENKDRLPLRLCLLAQSSDFPFRSGSFRRSFLASQTCLCSISSETRGNVCMAGTFLKWLKMVKDGLRWFEFECTVYRAYRAPFHRKRNGSESSWLCLGPRFQRGLKLLEKAERLCNVLQCWVRIIN